MIVTLATHRDAFTLAAMLLPDARWIPALGDVGQCEDADIGMEDEDSEATLVLHADGTATLSHHRLVGVTPMLRGKQQ